MASRSHLRRQARQGKQSLRWGDGKPSGKKKAMPPARNMAHETDSFKPSVGMLTTSRR